MAYVLFCDLLSLLSAIITLFNTILLSFTMNFSYTELKNQLTKRPFIVPVIICVCLFLYKFQYLNLGPYWDECWVYFPAAKTLAATSPTLIPGELDPAVYSGHPLLFLFLSSIWATLFGDSNFTMHLFPLFISMGLVFAVFYSSKNWFGIKVAVFTTILFSLQAIFLSQSSFLLLEVMVGLFVLLTYFFFFEKNYLAFVICGTLALWTKESAYVLIPALALGSTIEFLLFKKELKTFLLQLGLTGLVFLLGFSFFILQKINVGWFFYPLHIGYIDLSYGMLTYKLSVIRDIIFFNQGRLYITYLGLIGMAFFALRYKKIPQADLLRLIHLSIFIFGFIAFAAINFLSNRYLIAAIPMVIMIFVYVISTLFNKAYNNTLLLCALTIVAFFATVSSKSDGLGDTELAYSDMVSCHEDMVSFLNKNHVPKDAEITTHYLMKFILSNPYSGYNAIPYTNLQDKPSATTSYYIFSAIEYDPLYDAYKKDSSLKLLKRISKGKAWCEIYSK
jgi:hypothetical protein